MSFTITDCMYYSDLLHNMFDIALYFLLVNSVTLYN